MDLRKLLFNIHFVYGTSGSVRVFKLVEVPIQFSLVCFCSSTMVMFMSKCSKLTTHLPVFLLSTTFFQDVEGWWAEV